MIVYSNLIRRVFKKTAPIVLGGIEASLRRLAHYDWWENRIRRSILFDAKADYLLYGMADHSSTELARCLHEGRPPLSLRGLCYKAEAVPPEALLLPSFQEVREDKTAFTRMFRLFHENSEPLPARMLAQAQDSRFLIHNPPPLPLSTAELDAVHELPFMREAHPLHQAEGPIRALDTIRFALSTHRGCYGECNFCAIAIHQGRTIQSRSPASIIREAETFSRHPRFKGMISDVGGPTANMYGFDCARKTGKGACRHRRCLFPAVCPNLKADHRPFIRLLRDLRGLPGISKVAVASGLRHDLLLADEKNGLHCLRELVRHHVSGQMKLAPEHCLPEVLATMGKPGMESLLHFRRLFNRLTREEGLPQYLSYYLLAAHPGCTQAAMEELRAFCRKELRVLPRQAQLFTPTPSTWSTCMYWTESNPFDGRPCFVEKDRARREAQKAALTRPIRPAAGRLSRRSGKR